MNNNYSRFKSLLEYFVAHLEYFQNKEKEELRGYDEYLKKYKKNDGVLTIARTGQGYKGKAIQSQIAEWDTYNNFKICITIVNDERNNKGYATRGSYLHWDTTELNIVAEWDTSISTITSLTITQNKKPISKSVSIDELGLFDKKDPNQHIVDFFENFYKLICDSSSSKSTIQTNYIPTHVISNNTIKIGDLDIVECLISNHNIILHGAPGTGKTWLAKEVARALCGIGDNEKVEDSPQFKMVQFHPSYDYTDFVEGLRPKSNDKGEIVFERKDGVFKEFCIDALKNIYDSQSTNKDRRTEEAMLQSAYDKLVDDIESGKVVEMPLRRDNTTMDIIGISSAGNIILRTKDSDTKKEYTVSYNRLKKLSQDYKNLEALESITNIYKSVTESINGCHTSAYWATLAYIYKGYLPSINPVKVDVVERKNFVFLIDEINRGDLSKIFGELFFSIDPGYRGIDGKINTQYQNMLVGSGDEFEEGFYIPDNVYIIGTMNDIDRSVESMEFAMRRRFQFIEVKPEDRVDSMFNDAQEEKKKKDAKDRMNNLNNAIKSLGFLESYFIGPSYFMKLAKGEEGSDQLWDYRLKGLLREYLRGEENSEVDKKLNTLKEAYELKRLYTYDKDGKLKVAENSSKPNTTEETESKENSSTEV